METRGRRVRAIEKAIFLLDCFWQKRRPLSLRELEMETGWAKSTIHGLLASMVDSGVVEQNASDGKYRLGYHLFELGSAVNLGWDVPELCAPHLQGIVDSVGESAYLARLSGDKLILAACEEPHTGFRVVSEVGTRLPLHCSSQGKAILAQLPPSEASWLLKRQPMQACTEHSVTEEEALFAILEEVRKNGFAIENEEYKRGLKSVAAPIFDVQGRCSYAIGIICMANASAEEFDRMRAAVMSAAAAVSAELGFEA